MANCGLRLFLLPGSAISNILCPIFFTNPWTCLNYPSLASISTTVPVIDSFLILSMMVTPVTILTVSALQAHSTYILFPVYTRVEQALLHLYAENIPESAEFFKQDIADLNHSHVIITHASTVQTGPLHGPFLDWHDWKLWHQSIQLSLCCESVAL